MLTWFTLGKIVETKRKRRLHGTVFFGKVSHHITLKFQVNLSL